MKFQNVLAFEKHLHEAFPGHLSPIYMVVSPSDFERKKLMEKISKVLIRKDTEALPRNWDKVESLDGLFELLDTKSIFGSFSLVLFDGVERLKKGALESLGNYLARPAASFHLILGASSSKGLSDFYQKGKKEMVILDLSEEKPWDLKKRLQQYLNDHAASFGKKLKSDANAALIEMIGLDMAGLEMEINKLICFVGERSVIELVDLNALCSSRLSSTSWQMAEAIVWDEKKCSFDHLHDTSFLMGLIGQVRYHLQIGEQISSLIHNGEAPTEIARFLPQLRSAQLERYVTIVRNRTPVFFKKALLALFEVDVSSKSSSLEPRMLWEQYLSKLDFLKSF